jgi:hypothetical protein
VHLLARITVTAARHCITYPESRKALSYYAHHGSYQFVQNGWIKMSGPLRFIAAAMPVLTKKGG